jgi:hypothetical protein
MKNIIFSALLIGVVGGFYVLSQNEIEYVKEVVEVEKVVEIKTLEKRIDVAKQEAEISIKEEAQKAYDEVFQKEMKRVEDKVKEEYIAEIEATISSVDY